MHSCRLINDGVAISLLLCCESGINQHGGNKTSTDVFKAGLIT